MKTTAVLEDSPKEYLCNDHVMMVFFFKNQNHKNRKEKKKNTKSLKIGRKK